MYLILKSETQHGAQNELVGAVGVMCAGRDHASVVDGASLHGFWFGASKSSYLMMHSMG